MEAISRVRVHTVRVHMEARVRRLGFDALMIVHRIGCDVVVGYTSSLGLGYGNRQRSIESAH
jgi:hypothetical protein